MVPAKNWIDVVDSARATLALCPNLADVPASASSLFTSPTTTTNNDIFSPKTILKIIDTHCYYIGNIDERPNQPGHDIPAIGDVNLAESKHQNGLGS
jgi:hypothetical protein